MEFSSYRKRYEYLNILFYAENKRVRIISDPAFLIVAFYS
jgi:hypothetical protein